MSKMFYCANCDRRVLVTDKYIIKVRAGKQVILRARCPECGNLGLIRHG